MYAVAVFALVKGAIVNRMGAPRVASPFSWKEQSKLVSQTAIIGVRKKEKGKRRLWFSDPIRAAMPKHVYTH